VLSGHHTIRKRGYCYKGCEGGAESDQSFSTESIGTEAKRLEKGERQPVPITAPKKGENARQGERAPR